VVFPRAASKKRRKATARGRKEVERMKNTRQTSKSVASKAGKQLADSKSTKAEKAVAGSALSQTKGKGGKRK
jgi:hypothetical protein